MRVLVIAQNHPSLGPGGTEIVAYELFRALSAREDVEATFLACVTRLHREPGDEGLLQGVEGRPDELLLWTGGYDRFAMTRLDDRRYVATLAQVLDKVRPDIVHLHALERIGPETIAVLRRLRPKARIVVTLHDFHAICFNDGLMVRQGEGGLCAAASSDACHRCFPAMAPERFRLRRMQLQSMLALVDRFVAPSRFLAERFAAWGLERSRIEIVANGAPSIAESRISLPAELRGRFAFFGNIVPHKGVLTLLQAAARSQAVEPSIDVALHGALQFPEPSFRTAFEAALAATDCARWTGRYERQDLGRLMAETGWVVVPSLWWENAPLAVLEAFRHGRPVIVSGIGGLAELVRHEVDGLHVPVGDSGALAAALLRGAREPGLWERLRRRLTEVASYEQVADRHLELYGAIRRKSHRQLAEA